MAQTSITLPGTGADNNAFGTVTWSNPGNITADDASYATTGAMGGSQQTHYLKATNFGFAIPAGAAINGIECYTKGFRSGGTMYPEIIKMVINGTVTGNNKGNLITEWGAGEAEKVVGANNDTWGLTPSADDINSATSGVVIAFRSGPDTPSISINSIKLRITYTPAVISIGLINFFYFS